MAENGKRVMLQNLQYEMGAVMPAATLTGLFVSLCTIQQPDVLYNPGGSPSGNYVNVVGFVNLPCMDAPPSIARVQATEVKALAEIMAKGLRHLLLGGYYPTLTTGQTTVTGQGWRAVVDGVAYDILGAEPDSQNTQTRLELQLVTV
jgi:hypothetical protein